MGCEEIFSFSVIDNDIVKKLLKPEKEVSCEIAFKGSFPMAYGVISAEIAIFNAI